MARVCTECGAAIGAVNLYREFAGGVITLTRCELCGLPADKYIDRDAVLLFQDILLLKMPAYRHLLFNASIQRSVYLKLALMTLLCNAYIKQESGYRHQTETGDFTLLELRFYASLAVAVIGFIAYLVVASGLVKMFSSASKLTYGRIVETLVLTSFAQLLAVAAAVWGRDAVQLLRFLAELLGIAASSHAIQALSQCGQVTAYGVIGVAWLMRFTIDWYLLATFQGFVS
ncbi:protein ARV1-like isoform X1 [Sycon ciliatum]|uniref:protein ARV1-like isoform X1 n=1 Tax=Sycon ciliatum TaxID=27933 RepID=UPI0031F7027F